MKLSTLAEKAVRLPDLDFELLGPEHFSDYNFDKATNSPIKLKQYVNELRQNMAKYSLALHSLTSAYKGLRDVILEAEVDG